MTISPRTGYARLGPIFAAESIAVVGASNTGVVGNSVYGNLRGYFPGRLYPVNARTPLIHGDAAFATIEQLPERVDLVVIAVPARDVRGVIEGCIKIGHRIRGLDAKGCQDLADVAVKLGELALEMPVVSAIDVNPILLTPEGLVAVDALFELT